MESKEAYEDRRRERKRMERAEKQKKQKLELLTREAPEDFAVAEIPEQQEQQSTSHKKRKFIQGTSLGRTGRYYGPSRQDWDSRTTNKNKIDSNKYRRRHQQWHTVTSQRKMMSTMENWLSDIRHPWFSRFQTWTVLPRLSSKTSQGMATCLGCPTDTPTGRVWQRGCHDPYTDRGIGHTRRTHVQAWLIAWDQCLSGEYH